MMTDRPIGISSPSAEFDEITDAGLTTQLIMMLSALWTSTVRNSLFLLTGILVADVGLTSYGQIRLNRWNQPFYDALSHHDLKHFLLQLGVFALIAGALLVLNVGQRWLVEMLKLKLREGLASDLIQNWLVPGRAFRLANAGAIGVNPDQRMHEDTRHLTELSADLGVGLLQASILLVTFVSVLWSLSSNFAFHIEGRQIAIPGYMVWAAIIYSGSASLLSYWVGRSLIGRNSRRYAREADLRFSLVRVNEHIDAITLASGEPDEMRRIDADLAAVLLATRRLVAGLTNLTWITAGYGWFTLVAPILVAAPLYFAGNITFGGLMMASGAFIQVQSSLRWFVDNFSTIADWRATLLRVASFRRALIGVSEPAHAENRIDFVMSESDSVHIDELHIVSPTGGLTLDEPHIELKAAERLLIIGESGATRTLLFRTLAGLWPWGSGRISRPKQQEFLYMPRTPYLPPGTLREVLAYPSAVGRFEPQAFERALERLGLERLTSRLDTAGRWESELTDDEQQALVFARVVLHNPPWILIDEVLDSLEQNTLALALDALSKDLERTGLIYIGSAATHAQSFSKVLHLTKDPVNAPPSLPSRPPAELAGSMIRP